LPSRVALVLRCAGPWSIFFLCGFGPRPRLHPFPTRRSSDLSPDGDRFFLIATDLKIDGRPDGFAGAQQNGSLEPVRAAVDLQVGDRKSTRLNSSHVSISYAVFCLKKKHNQLLQTDPNDSWHL